MFRKRPSEPTTPPEWLIIGLGNPGPEYRGTRHNVGFDVVDELARIHGIRVATFRHHAVYGTGFINGRSVCLLKPLTFMNLSGRAVAAVMKAVGIKPERIVVITDDLDTEVGKVRMRPHGGHGGHNGHRSIIESLGNQQYARIRIGIGKGSVETRDHVLTKFKPNEIDAIRSAMERTITGIEVLVEEGLDKAITRVNSPDAQ